MIAEAGRELVPAAVMEAEDTQLKDTGGGHLLLLNMLRLLALYYSAGR
jgi:hypothetical protein